MVGMNETAAQALGEASLQEGGFDPETGARDMGPGDVASRDVIDLGAKEASPAKAAPENKGSGELDEVALANVTSSIVEALKSVYDPEIPVDIYELGLIYKVDYDPLENGRGKVRIEMTLTAPGCPVAGEMPGWVESAVARVEGVEEVSVDMTFDPPWTPERMSDEAKLELGWM
jgi:FeS assembly SUF system protein